MIRYSLAVLVVVAATFGGGVAAQAPQGRGGGPAAPQTPQSIATIDLTGNWVAVVTEDWRWRMVTPPAGDFASLPLNAEGTKVANAWTPAMDGQCEAFGMAGLLRQPTRLRISWQDPQTLKIETDNGVQTRLLSFDANAAAPAAPSLQGFSRAEWVRPQPLNAFGALAGPAPLVPGGSLKVTTTKLRAAWLRKNGIPYSENAEVTEHFNRYSVPNGDEWFTVTTILRDPRYYTQDVVVSSHFKKEANGSQWNPAPCRAGS